MASPLLIAALCMGKRQTKFFLFCLAGMGACLLSAYINTFLAALYGADTFGATAEIAPVVEEVMKLLPLLFYLLVCGRQGRCADGKLHDRERHLQSHKNGQD